jgi:DNA-binding CsgD family transcriptional regulator
MTLKAGEIEVVGRDEELAAVREFLDAVERLPGALVIEGEAGIGKTTLWRSGIASAEERGYRVLSTRPAQTESQVSYAGLADLLEPVLEEALAELPPPQRRALQASLLLRDAGGSVPDQTAIAFAFLGALRAAAREKPALVAVDDLQWLDAPSGFALRFAARRLREESVGLLVAVRSERAGEPSRQIERLLSEERLRGFKVGPLSLGAVHHLIQTRVDIVLSRPALQRLHQTAGGNPFFALELARALKEHGDQLEPGAPLPMTGGLRQLLRARLAALPRDSEEVLLFAAAVPQPTVALVAEAVGEDARASLRQAVDAELIELDGDRIRFAHPLFASALYSAAGAERTRTTHRRLAAIVADPEERARHLALGTEQADADVAAALDEAMRIARVRGAPQAAAELGEHALRLTSHEDLEAAHRRRLEAGSAHFDAGNSARARALFVEAAEQAGNGPRRAEALSRLARLHHYAGDQRVAVELFEECLADPGADASVRADAAEGLATSLFFLREELANALHHARSAARAAEEEGKRGALAVALGTQGTIETVLGRPEAAQTLQSAAKLEEWARDFPLVRQPGFQLAFARVWSDDLDSACVALEDVRRHAVAQGDESSLPFVLTYLSVAEFLSGGWQDAMRTADEAAQVALAADQDIGHAFALSARALVASGLGLEEAARTDAEEALALAERGTMFATTTSLWALGLLELSLDNPAEAHRLLGPLVARVEAAGIGEPGSIRFVTDDVEALVALGDRDTAAAQLERFEELGRRLGRRSALAASHRCRGVLAASAGAHDEALAEFGRALDELERLAFPLEHARTLLALGSAQRHMRQRRAARETLEQALRGFDELGASLWAERARAELGRISGRAPSRGELTASERRVAELVAVGKTNREVAAVLFVTPRTVEGTLSRVYTKLGVRSRAELARRWASRPD